ncbi:MAG TPA: cytochrome c3 family protein [Gallionella sp.]|nr:cytochrome c3 family protein [Gallionella sp.]
MTKHDIETRSLIHGLHSLRWIGLLLVLPLLAFTQLAMAKTAEPEAIRFDHIKTGFNLTGAHIQSRCESCHIQGMFKGTPRDCATCHMAGNRMGAMAKPSRHVATIAPCESCHRTTGWIPATFSHVNVMPGACLSCHNGSSATSKPSGHILTTSSCDTCHRTSAWSPAGYNHTGVAPGTCATCHNGTTATGKPGRHIVTADSCDTCHRTTAWLPAGYNHVGVVPGTCATCHNGTTAKGLGGSPSTRYPSYPGHVPTSGWPSCDSCHKSTTSFLNARVHGSVAIPAGTCTSCHYRGSHEGSGTQSCDRCHNSTSNWSSGV